MGFFDSIDFSEIDVNTVEEERVSGGGNYIREAGIYDVVITMAKGLEAKESDSKGIELEMEDRDGKKIRYRGYFLGKNGLPYYINKEGEKRTLPAMSQILGLRLILEGKHNLENLKTEKKTIKDKEGKDVQVDVFPSWIGKTVGICVKQVLQDKYLNPSESEEIVEVQHFYDPVDKRFASEKPEAEPKKLNKFIETLESNPIIDKRNKSKGGNASGGSSSAGTANKPKF